MSACNIHFHDKVSLKYPLRFVFLSCQNNFVGTQKKVIISNDK